MYVKEAVLCRTRQCGTMVDVSQVMIAHTFTCHVKVELLSPILSDSAFLSSKVFCFSDFRIWLLNGQNEIMLVEDLENFPFWIVFWCFRDPSILLPLRNPLSEWKIHKNFRQKPRPRPAYFVGCAKEVRYWWFYYSRIQKGEGQGEKCHACSSGIKKISKFICSRIKKKRKPRVKIVTIKLCGVWKSRNSWYEQHPTCAA